MSNNHGSLGKGEERWQHLAQRRCSGHHLVGDPGQYRDQRWDVGLRIDQGLELAEQLTTAYLDRSEFGDHVRFGAAGRFQVDDTERHLRQMRSKIIE